MKKITLAFIINIFSSALAKTCHPIDACSCKEDDGKIVSLWDIDDSNNPRFQKQGAVYTWNYFYNPCTPFNKDPSCKETLVCQDSVFNPGMVNSPVGLAAQFSTDYNMGQLRFKYGTEGTTRQAIITMKCDPNNDDPNIDTPQETIGSVDPIEYTFTLTSKCACPGVCAHSDASKNLSVGSILCILLFVFVSVYFIGGALFLKYHKKKEGKEIIPNAEFWKDMPAKVKDGFVFTKGHVANRMGSKGYTDI